MSNYFEGDVDLGATLSPLASTAFTGQDELLNQEPVDSFDPQSESDVNGLLWLGYLTDTFPLYGHMFTIKTLTRGERLATALIAKEYEDTLGMALAYETALIAAVIVQVDGVPLNSPLSGDENPLIRIRNNFDDIGKWFDPVIDGVYQKYQALLLRQVAAFKELESK